MSGRLHPYGVDGVSLARTSGSSTPRQVAQARLLGRRQRLRVRERDGALERAARSPAAQPRPPSGRCGTRSSCSAVYGVVVLGQHPVRRCAGTRAAGRPAWRSRARTAPRSRRCRSPRPLAARGRGRGPSGPSGTPCPGTSSRPGMSGRFSSLNMPMPLTTTSASSSSPSAVMTRHTVHSSSQWAERTAVPRRRCGPRPYVARRSARGSRGSRAASP